MKSTAFNQNKTLHNLKTSFKPPKTSTPNASKTRHSTYTQLQQSVSKAQFEFEKTAPTKKFHKTVNIPCRNLNFAQKNVCPPLLTNLINILLDWLDDSGNPTFVVIVGVASRPPNQTVKNNLVRWKKARKNKGRVAFWADWGFLKKIVKSDCGSIKSFYILPVYKEFRIRGFWKSC